ncbi:MAG: J domain-containing protein [Luteolibacter sp.]
MNRKTRNQTVPHKEGLVIRPGKEAPLSRTQLEFNRLMKTLETAKARHAREQARLDDALVISIRELMPLVEGINRVNRDLVFTGRKVLQTFKLSAKRRLWLGDLLSGKAGELLADPVGLTMEEIAELEAVVEELGPSVEEQQMKESEDMEFEFMRAMMEQAAREAGLDLDLSDLDPNGDPEEFERIANERVRAAFAARGGDADSTAAADKPRRKPTKAQAEKDRKRLEQEDAKNRDLKSLFKQLAKAFHPDLEPDPLLKEHKKGWMQRLNTAYAANDLREMLQLEMEWLGEEATNLATAGDQKLKVYCMVLKEQIADLKDYTHHLPDEPQYGTLRRFRNPYYGTLASPVTIKRELREELLYHREMLEILSGNNAASRSMVNEWADEHARRSSYPF